MNNLEIRHLSKVDFPKAFALWTKALGELWPLTRIGFDTVLTGGKHTGKNHFAGYIGNQLVGFVVVGSDSRGTQQRDGITAIVVDPSLQRQGIGSALIESAVNNTRQRRETDEIWTGGVGYYFWPGVPENLQAAKKFFFKHGWRQEQRVVDMTCNLEKRKATGAQITSNKALHIAQALDRDSLKAFQKKYFPQWYGVLMDRLNAGRYEDVVFATLEGQVVGTEFLSTSQSSEYEKSFLWQLLLSPKTGTIGALGVGKPWRERGIGKALAEYGHEVLAQRKCTKSYLGWVWSVEWYEKLGCETWRTYDRMVYKL